VLIRLVHLFVIRVFGWLALLALNASGRPLAPAEVGVLVEQERFVDALRRECLGANEKGPAVRGLSLERYCWLT